MTRNNIGQLFVLATCTSFQKPARSADRAHGLSSKDVLTDWLATLYGGGHINISELRDYVVAIDQCHDEVANVLLAYALSEKAT